MEGGARRQRVEGKCAKDEGDEVSREEGSEGSRGGPMCSM